MNYPFDAVIHAYEAGHCSLFDVLCRADKTERRPRTRARVLVASAIGDVHVMSHLLLQSILETAQFDVWALGDISCEDLMQKLATVSPHILILTGLLAPSFYKLKTYFEQLSEAGVCCPVLIGGGMVSSRFVAHHLASAYAGPVFYAKDIVKSVAFIDAICRGSVEKAILPIDLPDAGSDSGSVDLAEAVLTTPRLEALPHPPDLERHEVCFSDLPAIWDFINPRSLYNLHLGFRGAFEAAIQRQDPTALLIFERVLELKEQVKAHPTLMRPKAVWQFFGARSDGQTVTIYAPDHKAVLTSFTFPRQSHGDRLSLADYVDSDRMDTVGMFVVTAGQGVLEMARHLYSERRFSDMYLLQALAVQTSEALAEHLHAQLRADLGATDEAGLSRADILDARYRGKRFSFGYAACPDLSEQRKLFALLKPETIGVQLTDVTMMDPEASVSALVLHHPEARYFSMAG